MRFRQPVRGGNVHRRQFLVETLGDFGFQGLGVLGEGISRRQQVLLPGRHFFLASEHVILGHRPNLQFGLVAFQKLLRVPQSFPRHANAFLVGQQVVVSGHYLRHVFDHGLPEHALLQFQIVPCLTNEYGVGAVAEAI